MQLKSSTEVSKFYNCCVSYIQSIEFEITSYSIFRWKSGTSGFLSLNSARTCLKLEWPALETYIFGAELPFVTGIFLCWKILDVRRSIWQFHFVFIWSISASILHYKTLEICYFFKVTYFFKFIKHANPIKHSILLNTIQFSRTLVNNLLMSKFEWKSNLGHKLRIFRNCKFKHNMKILQIPQELVHEKFYVYEKIFRT